MKSDVNDISYFWGGVACVLVLFCAIVSSFLYEGDTAEPVNPPVEQEPLSPLSQSPVLLEVSKHTEREIECLALNSYFESRNQSLAGQLAVAHVVLNRVKHNKFPNSICEVIQQGPTYINWKGNELPVRHQCHFSWWCDGESDIPKDQKTYKAILSIITTMLETEMLDITDGSLYYHADYSEPYWVNSFSKTMVIDDHVFYKENGSP